MASSKRPEPDALSTVVDVDADGREQPLDEAAGATAFVRVDAVPERPAGGEGRGPRGRGGGRRPPRGGAWRAPSPGGARRPPAARKPAAPAEEKSGRRGAWWN